MKPFISPKYAGLLEYGGSSAGAYLLRRGLLIPWELPEVMDPDLARAGWEELQPLVRLEETIPDTPEDFLKVSALEMVWYMGNQPDEMQAGILETRKRPRGVIPEGLEYFSFENFEKWCHDILRQVIKLRGVG